MQAKRKKWLLIVGGLAIFLLLVTTFGNGHIAYAAVPQCSDGIDNDGDGRIDIEDSLCHTDGNLYNPASYDPNLDTEAGRACVQTCSYQPKAGRIIVEFDRINKIKSNGTLAESKTLVIPTSIPSGYYNISMNGIDGYIGRESDASQPNETWKALLMSGGDLVFTTPATPDLSDGYYCNEMKSDNIQENVFVSKNIDSIVGQHAAYIDSSSPNDLWPICIAFDSLPTPPQCSDSIDNDGDGMIDMADPGCSDPTDNSENQPPVITLLGLNPMTVQRDTTFTDPGATSTDPEDGNITSSITATGTVNTSVIGTYPILYTVIDSGGLIATTTRTVLVVYTPTLPECSDGLDNDGDAMIDAADPNCHTDVNRYNPASYNPNLNRECGYACVWSCPYQPKAGRIIVQFDQAHNIKSNGTMAESEMPAVSVNIPVGHYNISMESFDGYVGRPTSPSQPNETWKALLMNGSNLVAETTHTIDLSDSYSCFGQRQDNIQTNFLVAENIDSIVAQHAAYPNTSSPNDLWPVCIAFDDVSVIVTNQPPTIDLLGSNPVAVVVNTTFTDPGATATDPEDGNLTSSITATGTVNTSVIGIYPILYTVIDSGGSTATTSRTVTVVPSTYAQCPIVTQCSDGLDNDGDGMIDMADPGCSDPNDDSENQPPVITLLGINPMTVFLNATFTDPGATSTDPEDGNLTSSITATGTVNTSATGTYPILYTVVDSGGLIATTSRIVNVVLSTSTQCSDGLDNDGDGSIDINDKTCHSDAVATNTVSYLPAKNTENELPVITLIGASSMEIFVGDAYTDQGATAVDFEDGNITNSITATGTVAIQTAGTYSIYYNVNDSQGAPAQQKVRTVVVKVRPPSGCVGNCGGGGAVTPQTIPSLSIFNEKVEVISNNSALITWQTDANADSRVVYGTSSVNSLVTGNANYGYTTTTLTADGLILNHSLLITSLQPITNYYLRPVSDNPSANPATGKELSLIIGEQPPVIIATVVPPAIIDCNYLLEYLRIDLPNNPVEVMKLQRFLKENEGFANLQVNGVFGQTTLDAVDIFQMRYFVDVLTPWGYDYNQPTGYVYITTKKKVNEIYCQKPFPLTSGQQDEITDTRNYLQTIPRVISPTPTPIIGQFKTPETQGGLAAGSAAKTESAVVGPDNQGSAIAQATTSEPSPAPEISSALGVSSITNIGNIGEANTSSQGTKPSRIEPLFFVGFISKLANTENNLLIGIYLIVILVALAFVFIIIRRRRKQWRSFSSSNSNVPPFGNLSVMDSSPAFSDKL